MPTRRGEELPEGSRVYHAYQRWPTARRWGTAVITDHLWFDEHLEYRVECDKAPRGLHRAALWSSIHVRLAEQQPTPPRRTR